MARTADPPKPIFPLKHEFVYAELLGIACSVCAADTKTRQEVEDFANANVPRQFGNWVAVDKSKLGLGAASPGPCNQAAGRRHWFLLDEVNAAALAGETRR